MAPFSLAPETWGVRVPQAPSAVFYRLSRAMVLINDLIRDARRSPAPPRQRGEHPSAEQSLFKFAEKSPLTASGDFNVLVRHALIVADDICARHPSQFMISIHHHCSFTSALSMLTSLWTTTTFALADASGPEPLCQLWGIRHKHRRLLDRMALCVNASILTLVTCRSLHSRFVQCLLDNGILPRGGIGRVFMQEVTAVLQLLPVAVCRTPNVPPLDASLLPQLPGT